MVFVYENSVRMLTGVRSINASWSRSSGSILPGYLPSTNNFGFDRIAGDDVDAGALEEGDFMWAVITSYSIHYTKLYDRLRLWYRVELNSTISR